MYLQSGVRHALNPDPYRGVLGSDGEKTYASDVKDLIDFGTSGQACGGGVGGIIELAPGYLPAVYSTIKKAGGLCIAGEVRAGFTRTGSHLFLSGVLKLIGLSLTYIGIGNGIPLGAVVTTPEIAQVLTRLSYSNTFGGNPICTAAGLAVLKVIEK
ncbi:hypothetical protein SAY87_028203 [Trapa incisa]|uniref:Uncharacterized protein n=1 Tax=Trapa incisa TaxID=236973 RepID=A0AAN7KV78_9MYRT|nr:hypothetical protein SAY87_028203 [Trapa incisa]